MDATKLDMSQVDFVGGPWFIDGLVVLVGDTDDDGSWDCNLYRLRYP